MFWNPYVTQTVSLGHLCFEGEMLLQRRDDNVVITFLRMPEDIQNDSDEYWNISAKACQEDAQ